MLYQMRQKIFCFGDDYTIRDRDGREALRTEVTAELDGVPIALDLVVLKKDGCLYDLQLAAAPATLSQRQPDFTNFVSAFSTLPGR